MGDHAAPSGAEASLVTLALPYPDEYLELPMRLRRAALVRKLTRDPVLTELARLGGTPPLRPWVAEVLPSGRFRFVEGRRDFSEVPEGDDLGIHGVRMIYTLTRGKTYVIQELGERTTIVAGGSDASRT